MDVAHEVNAVERMVGKRTLAAGTARTVTLSRTYDSRIGTSGRPAPNWIASSAGSFPSRATCV